MQKYGFDDARPVLERASARETAARVALGAVAKAFLAQAYGIAGPQPRRQHRLGRGRPGTPLPTPDDLATIDASPVRVFDDAAGQRLVDEVDAAKREGDTLGGVVEVPGLRPAARASAATSTGTGASTASSPPPSWASRPSRASRSVTASTSRASAAAR
jgi:chorismate synthase